MSTPHDDDDLPDEIDFSEGTRGKFHRPDASVRLPAETQEQTPPAETAATDDPAFGMWRDREDMADVAAYIPGASARRASSAMGRATSPEHSHPT